MIRFKKGSVIDPFFVHRRCRPALRYPRTDMKKYDLTCNSVAEMKSDSQKTGEALAEPSRSKKRLI
jgi:hypothetical protein